MTHAPSVIVFDVNETLSDMAPLAQRFTDVGAPPALARAVVRHSVARRLRPGRGGRQGPLRRIGADALRGLLRGVPLDRGDDHAVEHVMQGMRPDLSVHPDVVDGVRALRAAGYRLVTLTNGAAAVADRSCSPRPASGPSSNTFCRWTTRPPGNRSPPRTPTPPRCAGSAPRDLLLVAVHPWDIHGASRAGLGTAWLNRSTSAYPGYFTAPDIVANTLTDLANALEGLDTSSSSH